MNLHTGIENSEDLWAEVHSKSNGKEVNITKTFVNN